MEIRLYMVANCTKVLGPHNRFVVWVQGCNKCCKGCISPDSRPLDGGYTVEVETLVKQIVAEKGIEGITISGGEPFLQQQALCNLIHKVREQKNIGVIIYTGMKYDDIKYSDLANNADLIIDGEYIEELNDDKSLRGSSNQRVICVTERYRDDVSRYYGKQGRQIELSFSNGNTRMIGIPSRKFEKMMGE